MPTTYTNLDLKPGSPSYRIKVAWEDEVVGHLEVHFAGILWVPKHGKKNARRRTRLSGMVQWQALTELTTKQDRADEADIRNARRAARRARSRT